MAQYDIITLAFKAYGISWAERHYLARLLIIPFLLKLGGYLAGFSMGYQDNQIGLTLCLLPAYFAEGWMLSHFIRLIALGHRWPFKPTGDFQADIAVLKIRARGVMSGLLSYVLINMVLGGVMAVMLNVMPDPSQSPDNIPPMVGLALIATLAAFVWAFRFTWLYIPLALNVPSRNYIYAVKGLLTSLPMIGVWILCVMPFILGVQVLGSLFQNIGATGGFLTILLLVAFDTFKNIIATAGLTYLILHIMQKNSTDKA